MKAISEAVCVLGMHRSGTSMITRALNIAGVDLGRESRLNEAGKFNPEGYWEHKEITLRQQQILKAFSRSWDTRLPLPEYWQTSRAIAPYKIKLKELVINEFMEKKLWGWKDPRTSLLLPMWLDLLQELNIRLSCVIVVRNPLDVASSLSYRNGFTKEKSFDIWCLYTLSSLIASEQSNRVIIHYDKFINNWESEFERVNSKLGIKVSDRNSMRHSMSTFLHPELQHYQSGLKELIKDKAASEEVLSLYTLLLREEKSPEALSSYSFNHKIREMYKKLYGKLR